MKTCPKCGELNDVSASTCKGCKAALDGAAWAQLQLGIDLDPKQGLAWIRKAADQQSHHALFELGVRYWQGRGVDQEVLWEGIRSKIERLVLDVRKTPEVMQYVRVIKEKRESDSPKIRVVKSQLNLNLEGSPPKSTREIKEKSLMSSPNRHPKTEK